MTACYKYTLCCIALIYGILLASCSMSPPTRYGYIPPQKAAGKRCIATCINSRNSCHLQCQTRNANIRMQQDVAADLARRNRSNDDPIMFDSDNMYSAGSCGCASTYRACYQACGGQVVTIGGANLQAANSLAPIPAGNYQNSCGNCSFNGSILRCQCLTAQQTISRTHLNLDNTVCRNINNMNGKLTASCS